MGLGFRVYMDPRSMQMMAHTSGIQVSRTPQTRNCSGAGASVEEARLGKLCMCIGLSLHEGMYG